MILRENYFCGGKFWTFLAGLYITDEEISGTSGRRKFWYCLYWILHTADCWRFSQVLQPFFDISFSPEEYIRCVFFIYRIISVVPHTQSGRYTHAYAHTHTHPQNYLVKNLVKISPLNIRVYQQVNSVWFRVSTRYFEIYCFVNNVSIVILLCHHLLTLDMWETLWCHKFMNLWTVHGRQK